MAHILTAVSGTQADIVPITRALISVSDKANIVELCTYLASKNVELLSTGGTAKALRAAGLTVIDVSDYTGSPECLDGRVKTLHPKVHGGLLGVRGNEQHEKDMEENGIGKIDMTILNLYPFEATVAKGAEFEQCIENIDIGGPSMLRSTAKNHAFTTIVTSPDQYEEVKACIEENGGTTLALRKRYAARAFSLSAAYDSAIASWFTKELGEESPVVARVYKPQFQLKYGCNPHQKPAGILSLLNSDLPFTVLNGTPGYINLLDAANAWLLVKELREATGLAAASSFKHVSPAGAAVAVPLKDVECAAYEVTPDAAAKLTPSALAYLRARNADPMCSFGDYAAVSDVVDEDTALILKKEVSDGIVAPGYTPEALAILKAKKGGKFIILEAKADYSPDSVEYREVYGMTFSQKRNDIIITKEHMTQKVVTKGGVDALTEDAIRDMIVASICVKYTQSNSVGFAKDGMMVGVGAGQQSRVDCVKLAGRKVTTWYLRQHPKVLGLKFKEGIKRQDRVNARVRYIEGDFTAEERTRWESQFETIPEPLTQEEKDDFMKQATGVTISSDAFFPFRDSIDHASKVGVSYVAQPGGSVQDDQVTACCDDYGMKMAFTGVRLFHH
ncbi:probable bifunctional purine synthesis protein [Thalassiosira pseudonana CCMP1335]|uniref:Probable bifunctional purine synthesis protein n=1 Tax=Thalassiosira pseudonana TaxID=35128 RepID=B8C300_THAPS|nr:probable bifunctional purine synthesis protein [Thalassiosira pseudonana CCMP1335]EED92472.1 probable bifunctional purine synthesis protein [Thalassiosira pseudonana CCMP1335]